MGTISMCVIKTLWSGTEIVGVSRTMVLSQLKTKGPGFKLLKICFVGASLRVHDKS